LPNVRPSLVIAQQELGGDSFRRWTSLVIVLAATSRIVAPLNLIRLRVPKILTKSFPEILTSCR
jgi:hypothetical protein